MTFLLGLLQAIPMRPPAPPPPPPAGPDPIEALFSTYGDYLLPVIGGAVVVLVVIGVLRAMRNDDLTGVKKGELKGEILRILRIKVGGLTVVQLEQELETKRHHTLLLLEELVEHGALEVFHVEDRGDVFHVAGVGGSREGSRRTMKATGKR